MVFPPFPKRFAWPIRIPRISHDFIVILRWWRWFGCGFLTLVRFCCVRATSGFCHWCFGLSLLLHVRLFFIGFQNVVARFQFLYIRFGGCVHLHRRWFLNSPTWTILQMRFILACFRLACLPSPHPLHAKEWTSSCAAPTSIPLTML